MTKQQAIDWAGGSVSDLAQLLKVTTQAIYDWETVPRGRQFELVHLSDGFLSIDITKKAA